MATLLKLARDADAINAKADAVSEVPKIYDITCDEFRPVTQKDVDGLLDIQTKFGLLMQMFRAIERDFAEARQQMEILK